MIMMMIGAGWVSGEGRAAEWWAAMMVVIDEEGAAM